jgi:hypothetical protein
LDLSPALVNARAGLSYLFILVVISASFPVISFLAAWRLATPGGLLLQQTI